MKIGKHWLAHNLSYRVTLKIEQEKINIGGNIRGRQNSKKFFSFRSEIHTTGSLWVKNVGRQPQMGLFLRACHCPGL